MYTYKEGEEGHVPPGAPSDYALVLHIYIIYIFTFLCAPKLCLINILCKYRPIKTGMYLIQTEKCRLTFEGESHGLRLPL